MTTTTLTRGLAAAAIALAAITLSGCSVLNGILNNGEDDVFSLKVGTCYNDYGTETEIETVPIVECAELHDYEVFARSDMDDESYPGLSGAADAADAVCIDEFEDFVGLSYDDSTLYYSTLYPSEDSWASGDREILCSISKQNEDATEAIKLKGSLKDAKE